MENNNIDQNQQIAEMVVKKALANDHMKRNLIKNLDEYYGVKFWAKAVKGLYTGANKTKRQLIKTYVATLMTDNYELVYNIKTQELLETFYKDEYKIAKDLMREFRNYVRCGHIMYILLGNTRSEEDLVDYRKLKYGFNLKKVDTDNDS